QAPQAVLVDLEPHREGERLPVLHPQHLILGPAEADLNWVDRGHDLIDVGERHRVEERELFLVVVSGVGMKKRLGASEVAGSYRVLEAVPHRLQLDVERDWVEDLDQSEAASLALIVCDEYGGHIDTGLSVREGQPIEGSELKLDHTVSIRFQPDQVDANEAGESKS